MHSLIHYLFASELSWAWANYLLWLSDILALLTAPSILLRRSGRPIAALSWLLAVFAIPFFGVLIWWIIGRTHLHRKLIKRESKSADFSQCSASAQDACGYEHFIEYFRNKKTIDDTDSSLSILSSGVDAFTEMESSINSAQKTIFLMFYIWKIDSTGERWLSLIQNACQRGVNVYILLDASGSRLFIARNFKTLKKAGCKIAISNNPRFGILSSNFNFRNHRKLLLIDEEFAYTGGMNIGDEYREQWKDLMIRISGPAVGRLALIFAEEWFHATESVVSLTNSCESSEIENSNMRSKFKIHKAKCYAIDSGPDKDSNDTLDALFMTINSATERVYITTPYFIPGPAIETSLKAAARRGVAVILLVPNKNDVPLIGYASRTYFPRLLRAGIKIYQYNSGFIHRKAIIVDDFLSILGSANVDLRSFKLNFELSILVHSRSVNSALNAVFQDSLQSSIEVTSRDLTERKKIHLLIDSVAHLMSPLL